MVRHIRHFMKAGWSQCEPSRYPEYRNFLVCLGGDQSSAALGMNGQDGAVNGHSASRPRSDIAFVQQDISQERLSNQNGRYSAHRDFLKAAACSYSRDAP